MKLDDEHKAHEACTRDTSFHQKAIHEFIGEYRPSTRYCWLNAARNRSFSGPPLISFLCTAAQQCDGITIILIGCAARCLQCYTCPMRLILHCAQLFKGLLLLLVAQAPKR